MIRSVVEGGDGMAEALGTRPNAHAKYDHSIGGSSGSASRAKSTYSQKRKSLSELWRFKSELQLNLSKKVINESFPRNTFFIFSFTVFAYSYLMGFKELCGTLRKTQKLSQINFFR